MIAWGTPRSLQGQTVEISYLALDGEIVERTHDRHDGTTSYRIASVEDGEWTWYASYEPSGTIEPPPIPGDRWRGISADRVESMIADIEGR